MAKKKLVFLTGTRADFGKLKSLIEITGHSNHFEVHIFVTGMHLNDTYGRTVDEIMKCGYDNVFTFVNHDSGAMDRTLAKTVEGFSQYVGTIKPDLIIVHGDRVETMAGALVGSLNNIKVVHIEGGEVSGTVDELIRHAVSKLSHIHMVANDDAKKRLLQMGEVPESIFVIGSPDLDIMASDKLPNLEFVKQHYGISFENYSILMFHPVTTEYEKMAEYAKNVVQAVKESGHNFVAIYPNNDHGSEFVLQELLPLKESKKFKVFPSVRFEYFLVLLKNAQYILGNSSAGIREAPFYHVPTVNIGTRQFRRTFSSSVIHCDYSKDSILKAIHSVPHVDVHKVKYPFGEGKSDQLFLNVLNQSFIWDLSSQKYFNDLSQITYA